MRIQISRSTKKICAFVMMLVLIAALFAPVVSASGVTNTSFVPNPRTAYAQQFIALSDGQQWFMDLVEQTLNISARSINTLASSNDLNIITSLASNQPVTGTLPRAIGELTQLRYIFLPGLGITGTIPRELYNLTNLENIDLSGNMLTGSISPDIVNLSRLRVLLLHDNELSGTIPSALPALENLDLANNNLTGGIPQSIYNTTSLRVLALSNNPLGGTISPNISALTNLRVLLAWNNGLTGTIPGELGNLTSLQALDLSQNNFTGSIPTSFSALTRLERLAVSDNNLSGTIPAVISSLTNLTILDLANNMLSGEIPSSLSALTNLQTLDLDGNELSGIIPDIWGAMSATRTIWLRGNRFISDVPPSLVARQTAGADVRIDHNFLSGPNAAQIRHNVENFISEPTQNHQVRLHMGAYTQIPIGTRLNVYTAFTTVRADNGNTVSKDRLPPTGYEVVLITTFSNPDEYVRITRAATGIYIELLQEIPWDGALMFELRMLPYNSAAPYTFVRFTAGTEAAPAGQVGPGGTGTGGAGSGTARPGDTTAPEDEVPRTGFSHHAPYITGFADGRIAANAFMTREQVATILHRIDGEPPVSSETQFPDVAADRWSADAIAYVYAQGIMRGYEDGTFRPTGNITRAEFATVLVRMQGFTLTPASFPDSAGHWASQYIGAAEANGLMRGYPDGTFRPNAFITRAEVMTTINRMLGRVPDVERIREHTNPFIDLSPDHWAFYEIMEATIDHYVEYIDGVERWL